VRKIENINKMTLEIKGKSAKELHALRKRRATTNLT
jgi:hypothetical protein